MQEKSYTVYLSMKFIIKNYNKIIFILIFFILNSCSVKEYNPFYFVLLSHLRKGWNQPEKVTNIQAVYDPSSLSLELSWDPSIDPDTNQYVYYYYIYLYYEYPQYQLYYDKKYLLDITTQTRYRLNMGSFRGYLYFIITAYDFGSESEISEIIKIQVL